MDGNAWLKGEPMRLSTRTEYAIDLLVALAKSDRKLSVKEMCTGTDMGPKLSLIHI